MFEISFLRLTMKTIELILKKELGVKLREKVMLSDYTTIGIGGVADYFYEAGDTKDLINAIKTAIACKIPYFVLGCGSNIIISDFGFSGLVILNKAKNISWIEDRAQALIDSGAVMNSLISEAAGKDFSGLEFMYGIPGTIGGAIYGNAGAYGSSIGAFVKNVTLISIEGKIISVNKNWMKFEYRSSRLKRDFSNGKKPIILCALIQFSRGKKEEILRRLVHYQSIRSRKHPSGKTCGCVFKNLAQPEGPNLPPPENMTAGYLLDKVGAKRLKVGGVRIFSGHANMLINKKNATANDARQLIDKMRNLVKNKFDKTLEEEIEYVGEW